MYTYACWIALSCPVFFWQSEVNVIRFRMILLSPHAERFHTKIQRCISFHFGGKGISTCVRVLRWER